jgi:hypothetical protein
MTDVKRIGDHVVGFEAPDLCVVRFGETLAYEDGLAVYEEELRLAEEHGAIFVLADLTGVRSITAEARKIAAELKTSPQILGVANFGVSFRLRVLAKLVVTLRRLAGQQIDGLLFMGASEADARAWIAERRLERAQKGG